MPVYALSFFKTFLETAIKIGGDLPERIRCCRRISEMDFTEYFLIVNVKARHFEIYYLLKIFLHLNL